MSTTLRETMIEAIARCYWSARLGYGPIEGISAEAAELEVRRLATEINCDSSEIAQGIDRGERRFRAIACGRVG
jgi:hypothetical protein